MSAAAAQAASAVPFVWAGLVMGISGLETPLKFRAPGITVPLGLGIGRLVFRALNTVEAVLAIVLLVLCGASVQPSWQVWLPLGVAVAALGFQIAVLRPALDRRAQEIITAARELPRSRGHLVYILLEAIKVAAVLAAGAGLLATLQ